jgi:hypothetical protein
MPLLGAKKMSQFLLLAAAMAVLEDGHYALHQWDPIKIGHERTIKATDGEYVLKTVGMKPAAFEIANFLTSDECDHLVDNVGKTFKSKGMFRECAPIRVENLFYSCLLSPYVCSLFRGFTTNVAQAGGRG